jgi:hypothetical protein
MSGYTPGHASRPSLSARKNIGSARRTRNNNRYTDADRNGDEEEAANLLEEEQDEGAFAVEPQDDLPPVQNSSRVCSFLYDISGLKNEN